MISAVVLALASVVSLLAGVKVIVSRTCSPLKAVHRRNLTPEAEKKLSLVCGPALLVVGASFAASAYLAAFAGDAASGAQAVIGVAGIALPALLARYDKIFVLREGRVVERGAYAELTSAGGYFAGLCAVAG